jgi:hypothetical protein
MKFLPSHAALMTAGLSFASFFLYAPHSSRAQENQFENEMTARAHLFLNAGPQIKAIKRDAHGRYYFLSTINRAVRVYADDKTFLTQIPRMSSGKAAIVDGEDLDVDAAGRIYVADRGGNAVKVYTLDGKLASSMPVDLPISVVALPSGQVAVVSLKSRGLVSIYDAQGNRLREFGEITDLADHEELNRLLNTGRLATDQAGHVYFAFTYSPEPTVYKYDVFGHSSYEISLHTLDIYPSAQAQRRDITRIDTAQTERGREESPPVVISAVAVDPQTQEVWLALGDHLMKFDKAGNRLQSYRTLDNSGEDLTASAILIEPRRILLADNSHGIFEFARPDLPAAPPAKTK